MNVLDFLQQVAIKTTVLFVAGVLAALALRRASASARYLLWTCTLISALALPIVCLSAPAWELARTIPAAPVVSSGIALVVTPLRAGAPRHLPANWLVASWIAGMALMLARLMAGYWRLWRRFRGSSAVVDPEWRSLMAETMHRLGMRRDVKLLTSAAVDVPLSFGLLRPAIVLPVVAATWTAERRQLVLVHELIHARRRDALWSLLAQIAGLLHWFNPLAWLALAQLRREQERSCDDGVVAFGIENAVYASHLVDVAKMALLPVSGALGMAESFDLESRVRALLDPTRRRGAMSRTFCATTLAAALAVLLPFASIRAQAPASRGSLSGSVFDPSGARIPNATLYLRNGEGAVVAIDQADSAGDYAFRGIAVGSYEVEVRSPGFATFRKSGLSIAAATLARMNVTLDVGDTIESLTVTGTGPRSAAPGSPTLATPHDIRVGGNVQAARLISKVDPVYPPDAAAEGVEGSVTLRAVISTTGGLLSVTSTNSGVDPRLARAAEDAVRKWQYEPTLLNGQPVEIVTTIAIVFRLSS